MVKLNIEGKGTNSSNNDKRWVKLNMMINEILMVMEKSWFLMARRAEVNLDRKMWN